MKRARRWWAMLCQVLWDLDVARLSACESLEGWRDRARYAGYRTTPEYASEQRRLGEIYRERQRREQQS